MVTSVIALNGLQDNSRGHCNQCGRIWTLKTGQGVCQWCGKLAVCQTKRTQALRNLKSRSNQRRKQAIIKSNGYDHLSGEWLTYYKVASRFTDRVRPADKEDILNDIIITLADVAQHNGHQPFTEAMMYRIASRVVYHYWYRTYRVEKGLDCSHCSKEQRGKCRQEWLYQTCPKAIKLERLNRPIVDDDGNTTELGDLIADDQAIDINAWLEAKTFLLGFPNRLLGIAHKLNGDDALTGADRKYLCKWRKREQKYLQIGVTF